MTLLLYLKKQTFDIIVCVCIHPCKDNVFLFASKKLIGNVVLQYDYETYYSKSSKEDANPNHLRIEKKVNE